MSPLNMKKHEYVPVTDDDGEAVPPQYVYAREKHLYSKIIIILCLLVTIISTTLGGFFAGKLHASKTIQHIHPATPTTHKTKDPVQLDPVTVKFTSNRAFLQHPSNETEELWKTLYPKDTHGLFEYPDNSPERAGFAAFHQLHCVDALRRGYYQREDTIHALRTSSPEPTFEHDVDETHTLHCIEFLRQSIMCHADTTVQTEAQYHQGILAFGVEYQCRNWWQLVEWVDRRNEMFPPQKR